jgi:hypothetical protein
MYAISNLATRCLLAYKQGDLIMFANEECAGNAALHAQQLTNEAHSVVNISDDQPEWWRWLGRETACWLC